MIHSDFIGTIAAALVAAFLGGALAVKLRMPPIVGYVLAGLAIGPYTPGGSADLSVAADLAEVGVVLLMFGVGLHFSIGDLLSVRRVAIPGALGQIAVATALGLGLSQLWGWPVGEGLILGLCLAVASTVVLLKTLEDRHLLQTGEARVAVGWLVVEDMFTISVLIILPAVAASGSEAGGLAGLVAGSNAAIGTVLAMAQAAVFIILMLFVGKRIIPRLVIEVDRTGSRELFTLCILALALGVAFVASELFGSSLALGAFLAGVVLNESEVSHRASLEALPFRDAFAVLFFVSVGMLLDPSVFIDAPLQLLGLLAVILVGKTLIALAIVLVLGYGIRTALTVSASLAQIGEFSFILTSVALGLGVFTEEGRNLVLAGAVASILLNPLLFRQVDVAVAGIGRYQSRAASLPPFVARLLAGRIEPHISDPAQLVNHSVICGYDEAARHVVDTLQKRGFKVLVIDEDPLAIRELLALGVQAIRGDPSLPIVLEQANLGRARIMLVTLQDPRQVQAVVVAAKRINPRLDVVVRETGRDSYARLLELGASEVVRAELEAGLEFLRHTLHRFGLSTLEVRAILQQRRQDY